MNHNCQLWCEPKHWRTRFVCRNEGLQCPRKLQILLPGTLDFREKVNDPSGCVRVPIFQVGIETEMVVVIWVFVQIVDAFAESVLEKEG